MGRKGKSISKSIDTICVPKFLVIDNAATGNQAGGWSRRRIYSKTVYGLGREFPPKFKIRLVHGISKRTPGRCQENARECATVPAPHTRVLKRHVAMQPAAGTRGVYVLEAMHAAP